MTVTASGRIWDDAESPDVARLARRFETDWRGASAAARPEPADYLPADATLHPPALLALLRLDLALRHAEHQAVAIEAYVERYPELSPESLLALVYEEYCLREDAGESPDAVEYERRFPEIAVSIREVLEIHGLIGRNRSRSGGGSARSLAPLPEAGETMAGFRLVKELGRGAFARVFLAAERELADRPVALKVTRTGSPEPQTLARLQHTHIVPVYSYRTDPVSGLHLLCMPYLGRITLAEVLADPAIATARTGADLVAAIDRLQPGDDALVEPRVVRRELAPRSYARAIAWWGARLAEALQHAHDRGVMHRDVKPSNILITGDGLPMLLDFNLAQAQWDDPPEAVPAGLGGTLAYMAPERLEALAQGRVDPAERWSDIYSLGVVLFECLVRGSRTLALPSRSLTLAEAMVRTAEARRAHVPRARQTHPDVPEALDAVLRHCLAADPRDRYATAGALAADLQAVADDSPLVDAREPVVSRVLGWVRRHRERLVLTVPLFIAVAVAITSLMGAQLARLRLEAEVSHWISEGKHAISDDQFDRAADDFATAARLAAGDSRLRGLGAVAQTEAAVARRSKDVRDRADRLFELGERMRFALHGFGADAPAARRRVERALDSFAVLRDGGWSRHSSIALLDAARRARLFDEVNDLLFLWVIALDREEPGAPQVARQALRVCDAALAFVTAPGPWEALRARYEPSAAASSPEPPARETSARACYQWGLLNELENDAAGAIAWFERAVRLDPADYWSHFFLAYHHERAGHAQRALEHYQAAVSLRPASPWAWNNRALVYSQQGEWERALDDLNRALVTAHGEPDFLEARLNLGLITMVLGDARAARAAFDLVIDRSAGGPLARAARLNRAKLDAAAGNSEGARSEYDRLLDDEPRDAVARLGRALLALRSGRAADAERDLTALLHDDPGRADEIFAHRALARLALGRPHDAELDAADAYRRRPTPSRERLWLRTLLASGHLEDLLWVDDPEPLELLPAAGTALRADLNRAIARLNDSVEQPPALVARVRAVLLAALNEREAEAEVSRAVALAPQSAEPYLVRARIRRRFGDRAGAARDVDLGLARDPGNPRLLALRGWLALDSGNPAAALPLVNRAVARGGPVTVRIALARVLAALGRNDDALETWSRALDDDPEDPRLYLGRAQTLLRLGKTDRALADLDQAAEWSSDNHRLLARIAALYAAGLTRRPDRFARWLALVGRTAALAAAHVRPPAER